MWKRPELRRFRPERGLRDGFYGKSRPMRIVLAAVILIHVVKTQTLDANLGSNRTAVRLPPRLARVLTDYEAAWRGRNASALCLLFEEDGFVLAPGSRIVRGRAAITSFYKGQGGALFLWPVAYKTSGNLGYIIGEYAHHDEGPDDDKITLTLHRHGDQWLIVSDMDNGNRSPRAGD